MDIAITPTSSIPDLIPVKRGAVIDWKATAQAAHDARWAHQLQSEDRKRVIADQMRDIVNLHRQLQSLAAAEFHQHNVLHRIRTHWSAFLLPRDLR